MCKLIVVAVASAVVLTGCETQPIQEMSYSQKKALVEQIIKRCEAQGVRRNTAEMNTCGQSEITREFAIRERNAAQFNRAMAGIGNGLSAYGNGLQQNTASRPATCTSTPYRTFVNGPVTSVTTNCY